MYKLDQLDQKLSISQQLPGLSLAVPTLQWRFPGFDRGQMSHNITHAHDDRDGIALA